MPSSTLVSPSAAATTSAQALTESINAATTSTALPALTPRSAEACRRNGIDPRELVPLPVEAFAEPDQPQELQEVKFAHYEAGRKEAFRLVQAERERVIQEQARGALRSSTSAGGGIAALGAAPKVSAAMEHENKLMAKLVHKQQAEIENMLLYEIKSAQMAEEKDAKVAKQKAQDDALRKAKERRAREFAEARRRWDEERRTQEQRQERDARRRQQIELQRESRMAAEEAMKV